MRLRPTASRSTFAFHNVAHAHFDYGCCRFFSHLCLFMDPQLTGLPDSVSAFEQHDESFFSSTFRQSQDITYNYLNDSSSVLDFAGDPLSTPSPYNGYFASAAELESPENHDSDPVFKFLNQILLEENINEKPGMFHDPIALEAAEKYFSEALDKNPPRESYISNKNTESSDSMYGHSSEPPQWTVESLQSSLFTPPEPSFQSSSLTFSESSNSSKSLYGSSLNVQVGSSELGNIFSDTEAKLQFKRGMEEAAKFLPTTNQFVDLDKYSIPPKRGSMPNKTIIKDNLLDHSSRRKNHHHLDSNELEEERSSKQPAVYVEEELIETFDNVLLNDPNDCCMNVAPIGNKLPQNTLNDGGVPHNGGPAGKRHAKKKLQGDTTGDAVDLRTLLIGCAQFVADDHRKSANEQLTHIRKHSSLNGDANQRLAYVLANGLEARLAGMGTQLYTSRAPKRFTAVEKLKAYQVYMSACPFKKVSIGFTNKMIYVTSLEAKALHLIDFGIEYGFQWPALIQYLSVRPGGPPNLRITGIDLPQPGFRPAELIEETGRRLAKYCERFGVPFEYNTIAIRNWEKIKVEDLKLVRGEMVAVNCSYRLQDLLDETVIVDSPRDAVLNLIRKLNPSIFVHTVGNGSYSSPFFVNRFREALFYYSAFFDIFDNTLPRNDEQRFLFEQEFYGLESLNVIACEGEERIVRPETYKQWQVRTIRAGFNPLPLNPELMVKIAKMKEGYHKYFMLDEDGNWMVQGWKGRILCASSCWVPS
ncbi:unnamed protein product [Cuscuta epithymum]|uniref:Scarecrow-like protein 14 n=2 Tax=Cuscuta epithymum TaxID=186058 RepID=A0AAV0DY76_9ASTE|nr:unnamed protein product [Cuscuta epithymum]